MKGDPLAEEEEDDEDEPEAASDSESKKGRDAIIGPVNTTFPLDQGWHLDDQPPRKDNGDTRNLGDLTISKITTLLTMGTESSPMSLVMVTAKASAAAAAACGCGHRHRRYALVGRVGIAHALDGWSGG